MASNASIGAPTRPVNSSGVGWKTVLNASSASALATSPPAAFVRSTETVLAMNGARYIGLRVFLFNSGGSANNNTATIDVLGGHSGVSKPVLLSRLVCKAGAEANTGAPPDFGSPASQSWYECDSAVYSAGLVPPDVRSYPDTQLTIYLDVMECNEVVIRLNAVTASHTCFVLASPVQDVPAIMEIPFVGTATVAAGTLSDFIFEYPDTTDLAVPGSGWQYVIRNIEITSDTSRTFTIHTGAGATGVIWGAHNIVANVPFFDQHPDGIAVGENLAPKLTTSGNSTSRCTITGVKRPIS